MDRDMNIAIAFNEKYIRYAYVLMTSIFENNKDESVNVYMMCSEIDADKLVVFDELKEKYNQKVTLLEVTEEVLPKNLPSNEQWTRETYFRLALPELLPESVDRILYLDIDIIVNGSLKELYDADFSGKMLCVCKDITAENGMCQMQQELFSEIGKKEQFVYFNAGVMLINIAKMRQLYNQGLNLVKKAVEMKDKLFAYDQDLLNYLFWDDVVILDEKKYDLFARNAYNDGLGYQWVKDNTVIIHYVGRKPWQHEAMRYDTERFWWEYAKLTPYFGELAEEMIFNEIDSCFMDNYVKNITVENGQLKMMVEKCMQLLENLKGR